MSYQYNPYMNNPYIMQNYQSSYNQQVPVNQMYVQQSQILSGQMVDSVEVVKAKDVDLSGNPVFYPNVNGNEIYKKQLMMDGTSKITIYKAIEEETDVNSQDNCITVEQFDKAIGDLKTDIISEIKNLFG